MSDTPSPMLVWECDDEDAEIYRAEALFGSQYEVMPCATGWVASLEGFLSEHDLGRHPVLPSARAACEADYARRWREAGLVPAGEVERLREVLAPFARCSEVYPDARADFAAGFASVYDARCPLTIGDFHRAKAALTATPLAPTPAAPAVSADAIRAEIAWHEGKARDCREAEDECLRDQSGERDPEAALYGTEAIIHETAASRLSALLPKPEEQI